MCTTALTLSLPAFQSIHSPLEEPRPGSQCFSDTWLSSSSTLAAGSWSQMALGMCSGGSELALMDQSCTDTSESCTHSEASPWNNQSGTDTRQPNDSSDLRWLEEECAESWLEPCVLRYHNTQKPEGGALADTCPMEPSHIGLLHPCQQVEDARVPTGASACEDDVIADVTLLPAALLFRDYTVEEMVGEGRYGTVWRCYNNVTGKRFACKQVDTGNALAVERELKCLTLAQGHPNVLRVEGMFESDNFIYILTDFCDSGDLFDVISSRVHLSEDEAREIFTQLLAAVSHCHVRGVLHRDLKPENVLLHTCERTRRTVVKLADFGLSTVLRKGECAQGWVGSKPYDAPEVSALLPYSLSSDIYSLGVVLFAMLSGNWPTRTESGFRPDQDFVFPVWRGISAQAKRMVAHMLAQDPHMRPTAEELLFEPWLYPFA